MEKTAKIERESGIELFRLVLMFMIIIHHLIDQGLALGYIGSSKYVINSHTPVLLFIDNIMIIAVNAFFFISGFYGIKFRSKNLINLFLQGTFYAVIIDVVFWYFFKVPLSAYHIIRDFFNVIYGEWWFLSCYFFLYLLAPFLNAAIKNITQKQFQFTLAVLFFCNTVFSYTCKTTYGPVIGVSGGYSLFSFMFIYLIGQYIYKYLRMQPNLLISRPLYILIPSLLLNYLFVFIIYRHKPDLTFTAGLAYTNPLIVLSAVSSFFVFNKIKFKNRFINSISTCVLGVYLIHVHPYMALYFTSWVPHIFNFSSFAVLLCYLVVAAIFILSGAIAVEKLRSVIFAPVTDFIYKKTKLNRLDVIFAESGI